jgi:hypothetical protein
MLDHLPGCSCCGAPLDGTDLDIRSTLPDAIQALPPEQRAAAWGNSDLQRLQGVGGFLRCLMPVRLTGGGSVTYSVWLKLDDDQLRHANAIWTTPEYTTLSVRGEVANAIKPWPDLLGEAAGAVARDAGTLPYLVADENTVLSRVLVEVWDRDDVLSRIWHPLPVSVRQQITPEWSIERTAGLTPARVDGILWFSGPGRTVYIESFSTPSAAPGDEMIASMSQGLPEKCQGELSENDRELVRRAFWLTATVDGREQHEFYGYVAARGTLTCVTCIYDDVSDRAWAQTVWRSTRHSSQGSNRFAERSPREDQMD